VFEEKIEKPMELYLHANSNVVSMNSLNAVIANAMEKSKLGEASFDEHDIFSSPSLEEKIRSAILYLPYVIILMMLAILILKVSLLKYL
jgi:hypothetical protein